MNLLLFAGNSPSNKEWIYRVQDNLHDLFAKTLVHEYKHWQTGETINLDDELANAEQQAKSLEPYIIFAKSVGTILTLKGISSGALHPNRCLFVGFPLGYVENGQLPVGEWLKAVSVPVTIAQNHRDPVGSYDQVKNFIDQLNSPHISVIDLPDDSHSYNDLAAIRKLIQR